MRTPPPPFARRLRPSAAQGRCDGVHWGKHTNGLWACQSFGMSSQAAPEFESVHLGRDGPRSRDFSCANDAVVDGRFAQIAVIAKRCGESGQVDPVAALPGKPVRTGERQKALVGVTGWMRHERSFGYVNP
jgi:hypothetical protein